MKKLHLVSVLMLAPLLAVASLAVGARNQEPQEPQEMPDECRQMMERHQQMQQEVQQMDQELETLVERMEAAQGDQKIDATAAVVAELVEQRTAMHEKMMAMDSGMMGHMMGHMMSRTTGESASGSGMMSCPMMRHMMESASGSTPPGPDQPPGA